MKVAFFFLYLFINFLHLTNNMPCYILLERAAKTEKNGIQFIKICPYFDEYKLIAFLTLSRISRHVAKTEVVTRRNQRELVHPPKYRRVQQSHECGFNAKATNSLKDKTKNDHNSLGRHV